MSIKKIVVIGLVVVVCLAVIVLSALVADRVALSLHGPGGFQRLGPGRLGRFPFTWFGPFGPHLTGWRGIASAVASYFFLYLAGLLAVFAFPRPLRVVRDAFAHGLGELFRLFGIGALSGLALILLIALGFFTFVAFPLPFLLAAAALVFIWEGVIALALAVGRKVGQWAGWAHTSPVGDLAVGTLVMLALWRIPIAGWIIAVVLGALALGAAIATRLGAGGPWSLAEFEPMVEETNS